MYAEFLRNSFEVQEAWDGPSALDCMRERVPDIVVTDLSLPGMDGIELATLIRQDPTLREVPIICLSGYGSDAHQARARAAGCNRVLMKPCMPDALAEAASMLLRERREKGAGTR